MARKTSWKGVISLPSLSVCAWQSVYGMYVVPFRMFTFKVVTEEWLSWVRGGFEGMQKVGYEN